MPLPRQTVQSGSSDENEDAGGTGQIPSSMRASTGYMPIENYGLIGNMHTCALVAIDGGLDFMCWPDFDSPSIFCRMLDKKIGGHFSIGPSGTNVTTKQQYLPSSNVLQTRHLNDDGVLNIVDFFPRTDGVLRHIENDCSTDCKKWLVRRVECIRGSIDVEVEVLPAFNYAQDKHKTTIKSSYKCKEKGKAYDLAQFRSANRNMELIAATTCSESENCCHISFELLEGKSPLGDGVKARFTLQEGHSVSFVFRDIPEESTGTPKIEPKFIEDLQTSTEKYWFNWISQSKYGGRWREVVSRSLLLLKLLTYEPTGAIVAAPTFSLPEDFGGGRNWDYRYSWVRDSSFTIYILLRMGFTQEAEAYMTFINSRLLDSKTPEGALPIMFSIRGETDLPELELSHLEGYRKSSPVRIGNGAATHLQLDIYGELMDAIYLYNKYGKPVSYDLWVSVRAMIDYVCTVWKNPDMSIWEVRGERQNFVYSKIMMWVAIDRALRLSEKRMFPCKQRYDWLEVRDEIYEDIMEKGYNKELGCFVQSYESREILDSAVLIAPLVFFISPNDPRFTKTLEKILLAPEKGGLTSTGLVYRYNWLKSDDGVGGKEGAFSMCTFWLVEALVRAGAYDKKYLVQAISLFENMLGYANHLHMFSEEIARSGEQLGNTPQAFSHLALISAAFNLDRVSAGRYGA